MDLGQGGGDEAAAVVEHPRFQAGGKAGLQFLQGLIDRLRGPHGVGAGGQIQADGHRRLAVQPAFGVHVGGAEFDARHIADPQHGAIGVGADDDGGEFLGRGQAALGAHVQLELRALRRRAGADAAGGALHVLLLDRRHDVRGRQAQGDDAVHVEPDAHGVIEPPEQRRVPHPRRAREAVEHVDGDVIADEQRRVLAFLAVDLEEFQDRGGALADRDALALHLGGQAGESGLHAVVDVDGVDVGVGAKLERDAKAVAAIVGAVRFHVDHAVDADDLRFQRLRDGLLDDGGGGARIAGRDRHLRRHDVGELRQRNPLIRQHPRQRQQDRDDDRQPRPVDEDRGDHALNVRPSRGKTRRERVRETGHPLSRLAPMPESYPLAFPPPRPAAARSPDPAPPECLGGRVAILRGSPSPPVSTRPR